jgi:hypothetical protein
MIEGRGGRLRQETPIGWAGPRPPSAARRQCREIGVAAVEDEILAVEQRRAAIIVQPAGETMRMTQGLPARRRGLEDSRG